MSVAVVIEYRTPADGRPEYVPVATEGVFARYWVPAAKALGCRFVPLFQDGLTVEAADLAEVAHEFDKLRDHFAKETGIETTMLQTLRDRSRRVTELLSGLEPADLKTLFIG